MLDGSACIGSLNADMQLVAPWQQRLDIEASFLGGSAGGGNNKHRLNVLDLPRLRVGVYIHAESYRI
jgi:hypothetical protein